MMTAAWFQGIDDGRFQSEREVQSDLSRRAGGKGEEKEKRHID